MSLSFFETLSSDVVTSSLALLVKETDSSKVCPLGLVYRNFISIAEIDILKSRTLRRAKRTGRLK